MEIQFSPPNDLQFSPLSVSPSLSLPCSRSPSQCCFRSARSIPIPISVLFRRSKVSRLRRSCSGGDSSGAFERLDLRSSGDSGSGFEILDRCSVKRAFLSMVFMIREMQSYALRVREHLSCEDLQGIVARVGRELNASFLWLFQQVFSKTPTMMVYLMILMANFTVHSMTTSTAVASSRSAAYSSVADSEKKKDRRNENDAVSENQTGDVVSREELDLWNAIVEEVTVMKSGLDLDRDAVRRFVSPLTVEMEGDDHYVEYLRTDLEYRIGLCDDPNNPMLLANYAQFLSLVLHDHGRAEECFKRAVSSDPADAEALSGYADFLWKVKKETWEAEERYQQAMEVDPRNAHHSAKYANFLWTTGGVDTCFPLQAAEPDGTTTF